MKFKGRSHLHNIKAQGVAASTCRCYRSYAEDLAQLINEVCYISQQIFNVHETAFYWEKMPYRTFIAIEDKSMSSFKAEKDRLTLVSG